VAELIPNQETLRQNPWERKPPRSIFGEDFTQVRTVIEYHITHQSCCSDSMDADLFVLPGKHWRKVKEIVANPDVSHIMPDSEPIRPGKLPRSQGIGIWDDGINLHTEQGIHSVDKVTIVYTYNYGGIDRKEENLYYRHDPHHGQPCPNEMQEKVNKMDKFHSDTARWQSGGRTARHAIWSLSGSY
jgi:hypothetical protein